MCVCNAAMLSTYIQWLINTLTHTATYIGTHTYSVTDTHSHSQTRPTTHVLGFWPLSLLQGII